MSWNEASKSKTWLSSFGRIVRSSDYSTSDPVNTLPHEEQAFVDLIRDNPGAAFAKIQEKVESFPLYKGAAINVPIGTRSAKIGLIPILVRENNNLIRFTLDVSPETFLQHLQLQFHGGELFKQAQFLETFSANKDSDRLIIEVNYSRDGLSTALQSQRWNGIDYVEEERKNVSPEVFSAIFNMLEEHLIEPRSVDTQFSAREIFPSRHPDRKKRRSHRPLPPDFSKISSGGIIYLADQQSGNQQKKSKSSRERRAMHGREKSSRKKKGKK